MLVIFDLITFDLKQCPVIIQVWATFGCLAFHFERDYLAMLRELLNFANDGLSPVRKVLELPYFDKDTLKPKLEDVLDELDVDFEGIFDM